MSQLYFTKIKKERKDLKRIKVCHFAAVVVQIWLTNKDTILLE